MNALRPDVAASFDIFTARVRLRLEAGAASYGDASLRRPAPDLVDEIMDELADVAGWSVLLWRRLELLRVRVEELEQRAGQVRQEPAS